MAATHLKKVGTGPWLPLCSISPSFNNICIHLGTEETSHAVVINASRNAAIARRFWITYCFIFVWYSFDLHLWIARWIVFTDMISWSVCESMEWFPRQNYVYFDDTVDYGIFKVLIFFIFIFFGWTSACHYFWETCEDKTRVFGVILAASLGIY